MWHGGRRDGVGHLDPGLRSRRSRHVRRLRFTPRRTSIRRGRPHSRSRADRRRAASRRRRRRFARGCRRCAATTAFAPSSPRERGERRDSTPPEKPTGCPRLPAVERRRDRRAVGDRRGDARDRRRQDPRHVGERDDPAGRVLRRRHAAREARAHAVVGVRAADDARAGRAQRRGERRVVGPHDGDDARHGQQQIAAGDDADAFAAATGMPEAGPRPACARSLSPPKRSPGPPRAECRQAGCPAHATPPARLERAPTQAFTTSHLPFLTWKIVRRPCVRSPFESNAMSAVMPL